MKSVIAVLLCCFVSFSSSFVAADTVDPPLYSVVDVDVLCDVTAPTFVLATLLIAEGFDSELRGFALERTQLGVCGSTTRVGVIQFGILAVGRHEMQWTDDEADHGVAYRYRLVGLDENGDPLQFWTSAFDNTLTLDYATCGSPVVGVGEIVSSPLPQWFFPCQPSCFQEFNLVGNSLSDPYVDTGVVVEVRGTIHCALGNVEGCTVVPEAVTPADCGPVPVRAETWSVLKSRF